LRGGASWRPSGLLRQRPADLRPYALSLCSHIEAAEKEAVLSHPHAVEGFEMGESFAELLEASANLTPYGIAFFMSEGG